MRLSIIINNYNYGRFVAQAVASALAIDWEGKEVIVVDDGSTDDSRQVVERFGDRITAIFTENGGQARAANIGFARSTGDVVIFLDADDVLLPSVGREVAAAWRPEVAAVQYGMVYVDDELRPLGRVWPVYDERQTPELVRVSMHRTGDYPMSPTSASAWGRNFLELVLPLPTREDGLDWIDMYLGKLAPFFGDVVSLRSPQCLYRRHTGNESGHASIAEYLGRYPRLLRQVEVVHRLGDDFLLRRRCGCSMSFENEYYRKLALVAKRFFPERYPTRVRALLWRYWRVVWQGDTSWRWKTALSAWSLMVAAAPRRVAGWLVILRDHSATIEKKGLTRLLSRLIPNRS